MGFWDNGNGQETKCRILGDVREEVPFFSVFPIEFQLQIIIYINTTTNAFK
jgi:hypothetical protein